MSKEASSEMSSKWVTDFMTPVLMLLMKYCHFYLDYKYIFVRRNPNEIKTHILHEDEDNDLIDLHFRKQVRDETIIHNDKNLIR